MALDQNRLATEINSLITANITSKFQGASPGEPLMNFSKGVAYGFVNTIQGKTGTIAGAGAGVMGTGIFGIDAMVLSQQIMANCQKGFGSTGVALESFTQGLSKAIVQELTFATLLGASGGIVLNFSGWSSSQMATSMLNYTGYATTDQNQILFKAISDAITMLLQTQGTGFIPIIGPGGGGGAAIIE